MNRILPLPFAGLFFVAVVSGGYLAAHSLWAQDTDPGRRIFDDPPPQQHLGGTDDDGAGRQEPRRRGPTMDPQEDSGRPDRRRSDQPSAKILPPGPDWDRGRWVLGITSRTASSGVLVRTVIPGSAASRAGLEPNDLIVTVDGFQVGRVGSRNYPLGEELQLRAGQRGDVLLLVQNQRNDQLVNLPVRLNRRPPIENWPPHRRRGERGFSPYQHDEASEGRPDDATPVE